ncbi:MAG: Smr/MutS family protein [Proteobacteria bacterium]|nr:Smr/MutS family protein [Pseudomonadota bacterium]
MARRKKRKGRPIAEKGFQRGDDIFNPALKELGSLRHKNKNIPEESEKAAPPESRPAPDEGDYFIEAMSDVTPLTRRKRRIAKVPDMDARPAHPARSNDLEVLAHLSDLVSGTAEMDITFSEEYIEGSVHGFDQKLMQKLKDGLFPIQDYVDLHGLRKQEAEIIIGDFLLRSFRLGLRCVLVVHGRGLNSNNHIPVLKRRLPVWLGRGPVKKIILAFSTARPYDGGTGAIYILLRRPKGRF